jgi:exosortase C (VPDSG-CTERM-specific)
MESIPPGLTLKNQLMPEMRSHLCFVGLLLLGAAVYLSPIGTLGKIAFQNDTYSHVPLIPIVSLVLLAIKGKSVFSGSVGKPALGFAVCAGGLCLYAIAIVLSNHLDRQTFRNQDAPNDYLTLCMAAAVAWVIGSFVAVYGSQAFKKARFALLFLLFAVPIPMFLQDGIVTLLQQASAEAADIVFKLTGISYHRSGLVFEFSNVAVQVAEECSGIRSSLSLFIVSIVTGYLFLKTVSRRVILAIAVFPITVVKNALRIMTMTLLANQVDPRFLTSHWLHTSGGIPFFALALALFIPLVWMLRKNEAWKAARSGLASDSAN